MARFDAPLLDNLQITFFPSAHIRHSTTCPVHQSHTEPQGTRRSSTCSLFQWLRSGHTYPPGSDISQWARVGVHMRSPRLAAVVFGTGLELNIYESGFLQPSWQGDIENSQRLDVSSSFSAMKDLYISRKFVSHIAPTLQGLVGERVMEVLPALQVPFLGKTPPIGDCPGRAGQVRRRAPARRTYCSRLPLGERTGRG